MRRRSSSSSSSGAGIRSIAHTRGCQRADQRRTVDLVGLCAAASARSRNRRRIDHYLSIPSVSNIVCTGDIANSLLSERARGIEVDGSIFWLNQASKTPSAAVGRKAPDLPAKALHRRIVCQEGDEAMLLNAADEIVFGIVERLDGFAILALRDAVAVERHSAAKRVVRTHGVEQHDERTPTGPRNASFFIHGIPGPGVVFTFMR